MISDHNEKISLWDSMQWRVWMANHYSIKQLFSIKSMEDKPQFLESTQIVTKDATKVSILDEELSTLMADTKTTLTE